MNILHALILGIIEGATEFLPISSTAHLALGSALLSMQQTEFLKTFEIFIQSGAMIAILISFLNIKIIKTYWKRIFIALIPTTILGFLGHALFRSLIGNLFAMGAALFIGGVLILIAENYAKRNVAGSDEKITNKKAFSLGVLQSFALFPGISRSGAMIIGGLFMRIDRAGLLFFTFMLGVPTIFLASAYDIYTSHLSFTVGEIIVVAVGFVSAFISAFVVTRWILNFVQHKTYRVFGWYRIILAFVIFGYLIFK